MNLPLHRDLTRCLAHPPGHYELGRAAPKEFCLLRDSCASHRTITLDAGLGPYAVTTRACNPYDFDMHIEVEE